MNNNTMLLLMAAGPLIGQLILALLFALHLAKHGASADQLSKLRADLQQAYGDLLAASSGKVVDAVPKLLGDAQAMIADVRAVNTSASMPPT